MNSSSLPPDLRGRAMRALGLLFVLSVLHSVLPQPARAVDLPIGVIEPQKVLDKTKSGQAVKDALAAYVAARQHLIESEEQDIKKLQDELANQGAVLTPQARQEKEDHVHRKLLAYQRRVQELDGEVQAKKREMLGEFTARVEKIVREIAEKEHIPLVIDSGSGEYVIYSDPSINLTERVIRILDGSPRP